MTVGEISVRAINLYLHLHQPYRFVKYSFFDIGRGTSYFGEGDTFLILGEGLRILAKAIKKYS